MAGLRGRRVSLTCHTGFKGSWLAASLLDEGARVHGFALDPPTDPALFDAIGLSRRHVDVRGDVRDREAVDRACLDADPNVVFHLAAQAIVRTSYLEPVETFDANIDAVQYAPQGPIDVQDLGCDFLVCSSYKFFGTHAGALFGRYDLLNELKPYKVRPASNELPYKFETGTQNHEGIAGVLGTLEYFEWIGKEFGGEQAEAWKEAGFSGRRLTFKQAMSALKAYEFELSRALIETIQSVKGTRIYGLTDMKRLDERVSTVSFTLAGKHPHEAAEQLGNAGFYVWDGHYYAPDPFALPWWCFPRFRVSRVGSEPPG